MIKNTLKRKISNSERALICKKYDDGKSISSIADELELNVKTVNSIIRLYKKTGRIEEKATRNEREKIITENGKFYFTLNCTLHMYLR